ncbi:MAG TPA: CDP-6-deoxy-delta-3,4-glucoseen reductase, partial [Burkholderiaceae bacterium]|nr:CDP-6-deoxy-delta-3,4-glucoseen reductase [Burkholderiaceae bacterium]
MPFTVTVQPSGRSFSVDRDEPILSAAIRQGIGLPYGCKDGACGSCKCRLVEGRVILGVHQSKALSADEEAAGWILTCQAAPQTDVVIEARTVPGAGEFAIRKMPTRVTTITKPAPDVAILQMQLPANDRLQYHAGQYIEFILRDGARRSYSMANAPHTQADKPGIELHLRHLPGGKFTDHVFTAMKEKDILRMEGPFGSFFLREDSDKPMILLASGTGFAPIKAIIEHLIEKGSQRKAVLYWGCRSKADLYMHDWAEQATAKLAHLRYVPVLSE